MRKDICEVCGGKSDPGAMESHHIVPKEVTEEAGIQDSQSLSLCRNCHREVHTWYSANVTDTVYDSRTKRFKQKSSLEMVKGYLSAFNSFVKRKNEQKNHLTKC